MVLKESYVCWLFDRLTDAAAHRGAAELRERAKGFAEGACKGEEEVEWADAAKAPAAEVESSLSAMATKSFLGDTQGAATLGSPGGGVR